jgi:cytochrome P450
MFRALEDASLRDRLLAEAEQCRRDPTGPFDVAALGQQPLMQSVFAEVCRYYVAIAIARTIDGADVKLSGGWTLPVGHTIAIFNRAPALSDEVWAEAGRKGRPMAEFDPERFLVEDGQGKKEFSLDGLAGCWLPFGGGQRMCPGRHFAKTEMLGTCAMLFTRYELELVGNVGEVEPDMRWYPTGTLPPNKQVPFRIRKRAGSNN